MSRAREAAGQTATVMLGRVVGVFVTLIAFTFQTRALTKNEWALVNLVALLSELCTVMGDLGLGLAMERRLPALLETDEREAGFLKGTFIYTVLATTALFCVGMWLLTPVVNRHLLQDSLDPRLIPLAIPAVVAGVWRNHLFSLMRGTRCFARLSIFALTYQIFWVVFSIALFKLDGIRGFIVGLAAGPVLPCVWETWKMRRHLVGPPSPSTFVRRIRMNRALWAERFVNFGYAYADQWVAALLTPAIFASYNTARRFFDQLTSVLDGLWVVPTNVLSRESTRGPELLARSLRSFRRVFLYIFTPLSVGLLVSSYFTLDVLCGQKYTDAVYVFAITAGFFFVNGVFAPQSISVSVMAPPRHRLWSLLAQNMIFLAILPFMAKFLDMEGVAIARVIGACVMAWMSCHFLSRIVPTSADPRAIRTVLIPSIALVLMTIPPQLAYYSRLVVPAYLFVGAVAYVWLFVRLADEEDLNLLEHILPGRLKWAGRACWKLRPGRAQLA